MNLNNKNNKKKGSAYSRRHIISHIFFFLRNYDASIHGLSSGFCFPIQPPITIAVDLGIGFQTKKKLLRVILISLEYSNNLLVSFLLFIFDRSDLSYFKVLRKRETSCFVLQRNSLIDTIEDLTFFLLVLPHNCSCMASLHTIA